MEYKIFKQKNNENINYPFINSIMKEFDLSYLSSLILNLKGFTTLSEVENYLYPSIDDLYDSFIFVDMIKVMNRLEQVIKNKEKVVIFSDYDCDGVTSSIILYKVLSKLNINVKIIIPNRFKNGYGLNKNSIDLIIKENPHLVITTDNGITSVEEVEKLKEYNIDTIISDHHTPKEILPSPLALINPKVKGEKYPFKELCGAGVAYKIALGIIKHFNMDFNTDEITIFAMIGTIADIVALKSENRIIAYEGLKLIKKTNNKGLLSLIKKADLDINNISCGNIGFQIAPRINAAGRLSDAKTCVELFLSENDEEINILSSQICEYNDKRKSTEDEIYERAEKYIDEHDLYNKNIFYILGDDFNEGVMGIAASKLCEKYNRPIVMMCNGENDIIKASCRSIKGFNIFKCLSIAEDLFESFGGHSAAAGFSIKKENLDSLITMTNNFAQNMNIQNLFYKRSYYDALAIASNLNIKTCMEIDKFAPFGMGNSKPTFALKNVIISNSTAIGKNKNHLKLSILYNGNYYDCIGFNMGHYINEYDFNKTFDVIFNIGVNSYKGSEKLQLEIKDMDYHNISLKDFNKSLYSYFIENLKNKKYFMPDEEKYISTSFENAIELNKDKILVIYTKDTFLRLIKYLKYKNYDYNISYNNLKKQENKINVLVLPTSNKSLKESSLLILDINEYNDYEEELYKDIIDLKFLKCNRQKSGIRFTREFFLYLYKKFKLLLITENNIYSFIKNIQNESDIELNYFVIRIAFDIMKEMNILNYSIKNDKINLDFKQVEKQQNINNTKIMKKLNNNN